MNIGYIRVSTHDQNHDLQADALRAAGAEKIYSDTASGATAANVRPGFDSLLSHLRNGDRLIVWRLDRLARSLKNLIEIAADLESRGVELVLITEGIDTTTPNGRLFFHIFGAVAEFERNLIIERTNAGLTAARSRGKFGGRRPVIDADKAAAIDALLAEAKRKKQIPSFGAIARSVGVSDRTVRRYANGQYAGQ